MSRLSKACQLLYVAALAAGLVGCGPAAPPPAAERLPGKWHGQMIVYEDAVQGKLTPQQIDKLSQMQLGLEFAAAGTMVTSGEINGQAYSKPGRWELVSEEGELLSIHTIEDGGEPERVNIEFDGSDTFYIPLKTEVAEGAMRFTRLR
jgi:hypothetical protein